MNKNNYLTILDFGQSKLRLGVFNKNLDNIYLTSKNIIQKENHEEHSKTIDLIIKDAEKKISSHLENIIVLYDDSEIYSVDLSIKKYFDSNIKFENIKSSLILEANQLIKNNYIKDKIIHFLINKYTIDGKESDKPKNELKAKSIVVEIKFICLPKEKFNKIAHIIKENNLQILNFYCSSYVKSFSYIDSFKENKFTTFLDIGWERSTITLFENKKLKFINSFSIGRKSYFQRHL